MWWEGIVWTFYVLYAEDWLGFPYYLCLSLYPSIRLCCAYKWWPQHKLHTQMDQTSGQWLHWIEIKLEKCSREACSWASLQTQNHVKTRKSEDDKWHKQQWKGTKTGKISRGSWSPPPERTAFPAHDDWMQGNLEKTQVFTENTWRCGGTLRPFSWLHFMKQMAGRGWARRILAQPLYYTSSGTLLFQIWLKLGRNLGKTGAKSSNALLATYLSCNKTSNKKKTGFSFLL